MDSMNNIIYICTAIPFLLSLFLVDGKARWIMAYLLTGATMCILVSHINTMILNAMNRDYLLVTIGYTPITEEIIKAIPILYYAILISDDRNTLTYLSFAEGVGFAVLENHIVLNSSGNDATMLWAVSRSFGASLMHGLCTAMIGIGISYIWKRRKIMVVGTFAMLLMAITFHSSFNVLVQSQYREAGILLPVILYIPVIVVMYRKRHTYNIFKHGRYHLWNQR